MRELKTLNDIDILIMPKGLDNCPSQVVKYWNKKLKQEAIKWIKRSEGWCKKCKSLTTHSFEGDAECLSCGDYCGSWDDIGMVEFAMNFFNITEEDLK